jgi:hypothetical protein
MHELVNDYLGTRDGSSRTMVKLDETYEQLSAAAQRLGDKQRQLQAEVEELAELEQLLEGVVADAPLFAAAAGCLEPQGELHDQALALLAEVHTYDDVIELVERKLKKGIITVDVYLRDVSDIARRQFMARYLLKKAYGALTATQSLALLNARFSQVDAAVVAAVLSEFNYNCAAAGAHLAEMCGTAGA